MNKEEYTIDEKTYENYDGLKIKIIFSNLGRRYKKIGENLSLMLEKETVKLEDSLTAMIRITKENEGKYKTIRTINEGKFIYVPKNPRYVISRIYHK